MALCMVLFLSPVVLNQERRERQRQRLINKHIGGIVWDQKTMYILAVNIVQ